MLPHKQTELFDVHYFHYFHYLHLLVLYNTYHQFIYKEKTYSLLQWHELILYKIIVFNQHCIPQSHQFITFVARYCIEQLALSIDSVKGWNEVIKYHLFMDFICPNCFSYLVSLFSMYPFIRKRKRKKKQCFLLYKIMVEGVHSILYKLLTFQRI